MLFKDLRSIESFKLFSLSMLSDCSMSSMIRSPPVYLFIFDFYFSSFFYSILILCFFKFRAHPRSPIFATLSFVMKIFKVLRSLWMKSRLCICSRPMHRLMNILHTKFSLRYFWCGYEAFAFSCFSRNELRSPPAQYSMMILICGSLNSSSINES